MQGQKAFTVLLRLERSILGFKPISRNDSCNISSNRHPFELLSINTRIIGLILCLFPANIFSRLTFVTLTISLISLQKKLTGVGVRFSLLLKSSGKYANAADNYEIRSGKSLQLLRHAQSAARECR